MSALEPRLRRLRAEVFAATWLSYAGFYVCRKVFGIVKAPIKARLSLDDLQVSHLWTAFLVAYMLGQFLAAASEKRMTSRQALLVGMSVSALANLVMGALVEVGPAAYAPMVAVMAVHGLAQAMGWPHNVALVARWTRRTERGTIMGVWATCYQLGSAFAKVFASFTFGWLGLAWSFTASSVILVLVVVLFYFFGHESPADTGQVLPDDDEEPHGSRGQVATGTAGPASGATSGTNTGTSFWRAVVAMGVIYFAFKFVRYALESWSTMILEERFTLTTAFAGYLSTAYDLIGFIGVLAAGVVSDRLRSRSLVIFAMSVGCLATTGLLYAVGLDSLTLFVVLLGATGFMSMGPDSLLSGAAAMDVGTKRRAALAAGVVNGLGSIGPIVQEPAIGWLKGSAGLPSVFLLLVFVSFAASLGTGALWWRARRLNLAI